MMYPWFHQPSPTSWTTWYRASFRATSWWFSSIVVTIFAWAKNCNQKTSRSTRRSLLLMVQKSGVHHLKLVDHPIIYMCFCCIPGCVGFFPSTKCFCQMGRFFENMTSASSSITADLRFFPAGHPRIPSGQLLSCVFRSFAGIHEYGLYPIVYIIIYLYNLWNLYPWILQHPTHTNTHS